MAMCMRCGVGIDKDNYVFSWTLMCKSCDAAHNKKMRKQIKKQNKIDKKKK